MREHTKTIAYIPELNEYDMPVKGVYEFKEKAPFHWLQRSCLWALDKLGCQYYQTGATCVTATISFDSIVELVLTQRDAIEAVSRGQCKYLLLGREQMYYLGIECEDFPYQMMLTFPTNYQVPKNSLRYGWAFAGMDIILIPWFDGIVCLRELN